MVRLVWVILVCEVWEFGIVFIVLELGKLVCGRRGGGKWRRGEAEFGQG